MAGTSRFGSTFTVEIIQDASAIENLRTSALGRGGIILVMRVDPVSIGANTELQAFKVDPVGTPIGLSSGIFAAPVSGPQEIGKATYTMVANTSQWLPLQISEATRTFVAGDSLQINVSVAAARLKVSFLCLDANATVLAVT